MILLDTSALVDCLCGERPLLPKLRLLLVNGERLALPAARLYSGLRSPRSRGADLAIAACALQHQAGLWTVNRRDFADIAGLQLL